MSALYGPARSWELRAARAARFRHRWGGAPPPVTPRRKIPLHRLCTLDLADPRVALPIRAAELPLLYGFLYDATWLTYEVEPDRVRIFSQDVTRPTLDFPYPGYPFAFPEQPFDLRKAPPPDLSPRRDLGNPFREEIFSKLPTLKGRSKRLAGLDRPDQIALLADLPQGPSRTSCARCAATFEIFCVIDPVTIKGVSVWGVAGESEDVKIVYERCPGCRLIRATNQCT